MQWKKMRQMFGKMPMRTPIPRVKSQEESNHLLAVAMTRARPRRGERPKNWPRKS
uniref:Uncharacterized protein n=1 Tax=Rhizophora mucronata TaxID=61149 RepID=A0A2P2PX79_RHIMU